MPFPEVERADTDLRHLGSALLLLGGLLLANTVVGPIAQVAIAGFVVLRYLPALLGALAERRIPEVFLDARTFCWSIFLLDLGAVVRGPRRSRCENTRADRGRYPVI